MFHVESANLYMRQLESKKTTKDSKKWTPIHMSLDGIFLYDGKKSVGYASPIQQSNKKITLILQARGQNRLSLQKL